MAMRLTHQAAFTLFEVAISLVIVAFGVVTVMLVIPVGIKVQQTSRMSLLASAKAMELIESFTSRIGGERIAEFETPEPWDTRPFCYSSTRWDFECRTSRFNSGIIPLPSDIANRLDSDGDEIRTLLASGAYLYYADPKLLPGVDSRYVNKEAPNEAQKMIFAVSGYAQNNAIPVFPWKAWPYRAAYPSPPLYTGLQPGRQMAPETGSSSSESASTNPGSNWNSLEGWVNGNPDPSLPSNRDALMNDVFQAVAKYFWTLKGTDLTYAQRTTDIDPIKTVRDILVNKVVAFCKDKIETRIGEPAEYDTYYRPAETNTAFDFQALAKKYEADFRVKCQTAEQLAGNSYDSGKATQRAELALRVQCMRFMAFVMSTFYLKRNGEVEPTLSVFKVDGQTLSVDRLRYFQDCCKSSAMLYAASFPYDWGAPRPVSRCIMMDHPLIEFDLFALRKRPIAGTGIMAEMWKPISAQTITSIGLPGIFPGILTYDGAGNANWDNDQSPFTPTDSRNGNHQLWGDANHFTLTRPFQAAERCRQLVFWSVDWQSYEDAETAPSAPLDASRVPCLGMSKNNMNDYNGRLNWGPDAYDGYFLRNPERNLQFTSDMSVVSTNTVLTPNQIVGTNGGGDEGLGAIKVLLGTYGADRNHNYILDRGPLPKSVRQRAQTIARFQFYDPRIPVSLR